MNKYIYILLAVFTLTSFASCGGSDDEKEDNKQDEVDRQLIIGVWAYDKLEIVELKTNNINADKYIKEHIESKSPPFAPMESITFNSDNLIQKYGNNEYIYKYYINNSKLFINYENSSYIEREYTITNKKLVIYYDISSYYDYDLFIPEGTKIESIVISETFNR